MDLVEFARVHLPGVCVKVRCIDAVPVSEPPCVHHRSWRQVEERTFQPGCSSLRHRVEGVSKTTLDDVRQLMREGVCRSVRIWVLVQHHHAHVENDVVVCDRLIGRRPREVPEVVTGHYECVFKATLQQQDVDTVGAGVHEGHRAEDLALVIHPAVAFHNWTELRYSISVCIDVGCLHGSVNLRWSGFGASPDVDVSRNNRVEGEISRL
mmetsp:Transcript_33254/g.84135  ORF Transcript_33254/g.84135 Transcript_33254/m.84135 type:complete len:209 (+) Transcript_33254:2402-3028(+)